VHAVSLTPHAKYDTACTIDERFERPWQPLKGISIKNIYVSELSYPTTKKIYTFKWATLQKIFVQAVSLTPHARFLRSKIDHIFEFAAEFKKALARESGAKGVLFDEKNRGSKISWHCPFKIPEFKWKSKHFFVYSLGSN
jgi:hypothetical protein